MRQFPLSVLKGGINRLRTKGNARADQVYDLLNGYVDQSAGISPREGTIRAATLNSSTVGLCASNGIFNVFANGLVAVPGGYTCNAIVHPTDQTQVVSRILFAKPMMGFLYVVAKFGNGDIFHYWLQNTGTWTASTVYKDSDIILPVTPNGFAFQAVRQLQPYPTWTTQTAVALNDIKEPTEYTGFVYQATAVAGTSPHTGDVEPTWPTVESGTVQEFGDFSESVTASGSSDTTGAGLGQNITDRYGNSDTVANAGVATGATTTAQASTSTSTWQAGTLYAPGATVKPSTNQGAFINAIPNGDFETGTFTGSWSGSASGTGSVAISVSNPYQGTYDAQFIIHSDAVLLSMLNHGTVTPGQSVTASCYVNPGASDVQMRINLNWYDSSDTLISTSAGLTGERNAGYRKTSITATAPAGTAYVRVTLAATSSFNRVAYADLFVWSLETPAPASNFVYEAIQAATATSGTTEPVWPTVAGNTVVDNGVTWKAIGTSIITWTAIPIMKSGTVEPTWPIVVGQSVSDGTMTWTCTNRQISDSKCPNTEAVALGASHVFAGNNDICSFSAAVDPTDWTTANNAGYLPTGLNNYGDNPIKVIGLYRSNLVVFNAGGYQMWQIDPDPANMAILDAQPIGSVWPRACQSVANDLLFLAEVGVRNLGTVGGTANLQVGSLGQPVDNIVVPQITAGTYDPIALYYPGRGQYWLIFGPQAFVFTVNANNMKSWSRYVFPSAITDWTLNAGSLYLRTASNLVWKMDANTFVDDYGGTPVNFNGVIQWPYLDAGLIGYNKLLHGVDIVGDGQVTIQIGFLESDPTTFSDNPGFATSLNVTAPYTIAAADSVPGQPIPIPINAPSYSLILTFGPNQDWSWQAASLYITDQQGGGALG